MPDSSTRAPKHPTIETVTNAIADWVNRYRLKLGGAGGLGLCGPADVKQMASDLGLSTGELKSLAAKWPDAADPLRKMLVGLGVDPNALAKADPAVMRDLQRLCVACDHKRRCRLELAKGTAAAHFHEFCPNAYTLDALFAQEAATTHQ